MVLGTVRTEYHAASDCDLILGRVNRSLVLPPHTQTMSALCMPKLSSDSSPSTESLSTRVAGVECGRAVLAFNTSR